MLEHASDRSAASRANPVNEATVADARRPWKAPVVETLPQLRELTLQSPIGGGGEIGDGGASTVF